MVEFRRKFQSFCLAFVMAGIVVMVCAFVHVVIDNLFGAPDSLVWGFLWGCALANFYFLDVNK